MADTKLIRVASFGRVSTTNHGQDELFLASLPAACTVGAERSACNDAEWGWLPAQDVSLGIHKPPLLDKKSPKNESDPVSLKE
jgi:hypothetical protein